MSRRTYSALQLLETFEDRFEYLKLKAGVGMDTFGHERYLNQRFYSSKEWKRLRDEVIVRDQGCDLGIHGREIVGKIMVHHMNPMTPREIAYASYDILDLSQMISVSHPTHNAIHYGALSTLKPTVTMERTPNDMAPWRN